MMMIAVLRSPDFTTPRDWCLLRLSDWGDEENMVENFVKKVPTDESTNIRVVIKVHPYVAGA
jgi:hypothetical protein